MRSADALVGPRLSGTQRPTASLALASALGASTGLLAFAGRQDLREAVLIAAFGAIFMVLSWCDLDRRVIPNRIVYPALLAALTLSPAWADRGLVESLAGGTGAFVMAMCVSALSRGGLGDGDVKMMALVGAVLGYPLVMSAALITVLAGGVVAAALVVSGRAGRRTALPYGPFIALGGMTALLG